MEYLLTSYANSILETTDTKVIQQFQRWIRDWESFLIDVEYVKFQLLFCWTKTILNSFHGHIPATYKQTEYHCLNRLKENKRFKGFILKIMPWCHVDKIIEASSLPTINSTTRHWWRFLSFHIFLEFFIEWLESMKSFSYFLIFLLSNSKTPLCINIMTI